MRSYRESGKMQVDTMYMLSSHLKSEHVILILLFYLLVQTVFIKCLKLNNTVLRMKHSVEHRNIENVSALCSRSSESMEERGMQLTTFHI